MRSEKFEEVLRIIQKEPNFETFEYKDYKCVIRRNMMTGGLCGYVAIPETSKFYEQDLSDKIECHGGLTWQGSLEPELSGYYIGFDCMHFMDYSPFTQMMLPIELRRQIEVHETYRDINYVRSECRSIVDQLIKL